MKRSHTFFTVFPGHAFPAVTLLPRPVVRARAAVLAGGARASAFQPWAPKSESQGRLVKHKTKWGDLLEPETNVY